MNEVVQLKRVLSDCADKLTDDERRGINVRLLLMYHLSTMLINFSAEIESVMNRQGLFKMTIKHHHKKIRSLVRDSIDFAVHKKLTEKEVEDLCDDYDELEKLVKVFGGIYEEEKE